MFKISRPSFAENKDFTDHGGSCIKKNLTLELKTPQTQKQLPAYIQNILNKGLTKPGIIVIFIFQHKQIYSLYKT